MKGKTIEEWMQDRNTEDLIKEYESRYTFGKKNEKIYISDVNGVYNFAAEYSSKIEGCPYDTLLFFCIDAALKTGYMLGSRERRDQKRALKGD